MSTWKADTDVTSNTLEATEKSSDTPEATEVPSDTPEATEEPSDTPEATEAPSNTPEATEVPSDTPEATEEPSDTPEATEEPSNTPEATEEPSNTPEVTEEPSNTPEATEVPSDTPEATEEPSDTPEATEVPSDTPEATEEPSDTPEATEVPSDTPENTSTPTETVEATVKDTATPTLTETSAAVSTDTPTPTATLTETTSGTATSTPTLTATATATETATATMTETVAGTPTLTVQAEVPPAPFESAYYIYDGDDNMVMSVINGVTTYYPSSSYVVEVDGSDTTVRKTYTAGSTSLAVRTIVNSTENTLNWMLSDHLGSSSITTAVDGTWNSEIRYSAFGETRYSSGITPTDYRYTGQLEQKDVNLYYYNARYYDTALGRFVQADTIVPNPASQKSYDRYTYVNNNPVKYTDPSGHCYTDSGAWIPGGGDGACSFKTSTSAPTQSNPLVVLVGGSYGESNPWATTGPDPLWQLPAYATNPFNYDVLPITYMKSTSEFSFAQYLIDIVPTNRPVYYICYSASPGACLIAADDRIQKHNSNPEIGEVLGVASLGGTYPQYNLLYRLLQFTFDFITGQAPGFDEYANRIYENKVPIVLIDDNSGAEGGARRYDEYYKDPELLWDGKMTGLEHYGDPDLTYTGNLAPLNVNTYLATSVWDFFVTGNWEWPPK